MRSDKEQAIKLRLSGKSYLEINRILNVPKSTLSGWLSGLIISAEKKDRIYARGNKKAIEALLKRNKFQSSSAIKRADEIRFAATRQVQKLNANELLVLGASLYWAEGYKRPNVRNGREVTYHAVSLTNSDPLLVKAFIKFLHEVCNVPYARMKASLRLFKHINEIEAKNFWRGITGIPLENFNKSYFGISKSSLGKRPFNRLPFGVIQVVVADTKLFYRIMGYIDGIKGFV